MPDQSSPCACGCGAPAPGRDKCGVWRRYVRGHNRRRPLLERFWEKVEKTDRCWLWTARRNEKGYGAFKLFEGVGRTVQAHRFSYEMAYGPIPTGLACCHRCDTPSCVRPDHLFLGTVTENNADRDAKGRHRLSRTSGV